MWRNTTLVDGSSSWRRVIDQARHGFCRIHRIEQDAFCCREQSNRLKALRRGDAVARADVVWSVKRSSGVTRVAIPASSAASLAIRSARSRLNYSPPLTATP